MIRQVIWSSMIDYPSHICSVLFFDSCNFDCKYCFNKGLSRNPSVDFNMSILPKLIERQAFVNYIILSGGECTLSPHFEDIVDILYENGFKIGIHTNGYYPEILEKTLPKLSFVGMDIKTSFNNYERATGINNIDITRIQTSIQLILQSSVEYEFRTTLYPEAVNGNDVVQIAYYLSKNGANGYILQQYYDHDRTNIPYPRETIEKMAEDCSKILPTKTRGL